jgi:microcystin-dependent protein
MSTCSNCYNGCTEIVSDRCVKYTGIDVPVLGIQTGDSLSFVEQALITFLTSTLDGTGVKINLTGIDVCALVQNYLPTCKDLTIVDISKALVQAACDLQEQVDDVVAELAVLNANYTIGCLTGVTASSDTHAIVQAVINTLCELNTDFAQLLIDLPNTYVAIADIDVLIQDYIDNNTNFDSIRSRMVPYAVLPYFGPISGIFDTTGAGLNLTGTGGQDWTKIYLCNGNNGTPDLRGRALTGVISGLSGPTMSPVVDPGVSIANPNYTLGSTAGANQITLLDTQIPIHTHANTVNTVLTDPGHTHGYRYGINYPGGSNTVVLGPTNNGTKQTDSSGVDGTGITAVTTITNAPAPIGGGLPHANIQPVTACYYIQYRP